MDKYLSISDGDFRAVIYLDGLSDLPMPNIRKVFRYLANTPDHQASVAALEAHLTANVDDSKAVWVDASRAYQDGWRLVEDKRSRAGRAMMAENDRLHKAVKRAKARHDRWVRLQRLWEAGKY